MNKHYFLLTVLLLIFLALGVFSCSSSNQSTQTAPFPTPFVLDKIIESEQISSTGDALCPEEDYYRSLPADYQAKGWELLVEHPPVSTGAGIGGISVSDGILLALDTYEVPAQQMITVSLQYQYLGSGPEDTLPLPMRFILLLDEQQVTTQLNGSVQPYSDVVFHPREQGTITFDVPPLQPGIHDLNLVGIANVDKAPDYNETGMLRYRFTLVADGKKFLAARPYSSLRTVKRYRSGESGIYLQASLEKNQVLDWNYPDPILPLPLGQPLDFYIYAGYLSAYNSAHPKEPEAEQQPFSLILFEDYQQSAFSSETPVIYGIVSPGTAYVRIPVHLQPPQSLGLHQIVVARIPYPGFPMCLLQQSGENTRTYMYDFYINRVGINIVP